MLTRRFALPVNSAQTKIGDTESEDDMTRLNGFMIATVALLVVSNTLAWIKILEVNPLEKPCFAACERRDGAQADEPVSLNTDLSDLKEQVDYLTAELADQRALVDELKEKISVEGGE